MPFQLLLQRNNTVINQYRNNNNQHVEYVFGDCSGDVIKEIICKMGCTLSRASAEPICTDTQYVSVQETVASFPQFRNT